MTLHGLLEAFTTEAALRLSVATDSGDEIPFEVVETPSGGTGRRRGIPLYCYRPLTGAFIRSHLGLLSALPTYAPAARALEHALGTESYLRARGETKIPELPRERADIALRLFLAKVFEERSRFEYDVSRFGTAYEELERSLYQGLCVTELVAPLYGLDLDPATEELVLGEGLSLVRGQALADSPGELWGEDGNWNCASGGGLLIVLRMAQERTQPPPIALAKARFRRILTALRLFEPGSYAIGAVGFARTDGGVWNAVSLGTTGRSRLLTQIPAAQEDELRAFCSLIGRRLPTAGLGEAGWSLARFEMGCEREHPLEALTDHLLALRALLEPEGPASARLAQRLSVICAPPEGRRALAERTARAIALERAVVMGIAAGDGPGGPEVLVAELAENLRAILRDVLCGHLDADVRTVADELLGEAAEAL